MRNWKTSLAGAAMILTTIVGIINHVIEGSPVDVAQHVAEAMAGIGLLAAKDHNK